ncbi:MAG: hypothetical protein ACFFCS_25395 [Candidatus Hodarchaeota archaeon]
MIEISETIFPIEGVLRTPLMLMEWYFAFACFEIGLFFILRYLKERHKELRNLQELGYSSLLLGFSLMWFFFIISDYYSSTSLQQPFLLWESGSERMLFLTLGYLALIVGAFICVILMERYMIFLFRRYFFTIIFLSLVVGFIIVFFIDIETVQAFVYVFWPVFIIFFLVYFYRFNKKSKSKQKAQSGISRFLVGFILMAVGFLFSTDSFISIFSQWIRLIGAGIQLLSIGLISYFFITKPSFIEFDWEDKIKSLYLIHKSGISLYYHNFQEGLKETDSHLVSGAITTVNIMLGEITNTKAGEISVIDREKEQLIIYPSKYVTGVVFSKEALNIIKARLREFISRIELIYSNILEDWDGDLYYISTINNVAKEFFPL